MTDQKRFGRYLIVGELGRGAMGTVHLAKDPLIERDVAIKTLLPSLPDEVMGDVRERFLREARSAGRLNHPNIVTIFDVGEQDGWLTSRWKCSKAARCIRCCAIRRGCRSPPSSRRRRGAGRRRARPCAALRHRAPRREAREHHGVGRRPRQADRFRRRARALLVHDPDRHRARLAQVHVARAGDRAGGRSALGHLFARRGALPDARAPHAVRAGGRHQRVGAHAPHRRRAPSSGDRARSRAARGIRPDPRARARQVARGPLPARRRHGERAAQRAAGRRLRHGRGGRARAPHARRRPRAGAARPDARAADRGPRRLLEGLRPAGAGAPARGGGRAQAPRGGAAAPPGIRRAKARGRRARPVVDERTRKLQSDKRIDERLRAAFGYLGQFGAMLRQAHPVSKRRFGLTYFGETPGLALVDGLADYRFRRVEDEERFDYVVFKLKVSFARPERLEVSGEQLPKIRQRLDKMEVRYQALEKKNDFGMVVHANLMVTGPFTCEIVLRGDYDKPGFVVEMENVGRSGASRFRIGAEELTDETLDELGTWLLGADDAFARFIERRT